MGIFYTPHLKQMPIPWFGDNVPQFASSLPSQQSLSPSQRKLEGIQRLLLSHWWAQPSTRWAHSSSSERSWHWDTPSHTWLSSMHFFLWAHWNWSARDTRRDHENGLYAEGEQQGTFLSRNTKSHSCHCRYLTQICQYYHLTFFYIRDPNMNITHTLPRRHQ